MANPRKPVPAGGQPTPAAIAAADATPLTSASPPVAPPTTEQAADADGRDDVDELVDAAVLVAFGEHVPDDIVSGLAAEIEQLKLAGKVDPHPDAVAFARSLAE